MDADLLYLLESQHRGGSASPVSGRFVDMTKDEISHHVEGEDSEAFRKLRRSFGLADAHGLTQGQRGSTFVQLS